MRTLFILLFLVINCAIHAQIDLPEHKSPETLDSMYIALIENKIGRAKVLHAEPLYIDLIRDLGARKGEKEWNVGFGLTDNNNYDKYEALIEYEWAPIDRLGLEVELPFSFYYPHSEAVNTPKSKLNSLKLAGQWSFLVSEKHNTSLALGYIHEFELPEFDAYKSDNFIQGQVFNPFFVAAKRWGNNFHTLLYTGPKMLQHFNSNHWDRSFQVNSNIHYMISGTRNFIGVEFNKEITSKDFDMIIRPQMRLALANNLMVGIVAGIPVSRENQRFSTFCRIIYEPGHH
jgi:hypothetical protein